MTCNEYQEWISAYVDNELDEERAAPLFAHLGACAECRGFFRGSLELRSLLLDDLVKERERLEEASRQPALTAQLALPIVALLVVLFLFLGISRMGPSPEAMYGSAPFEQVQPPAPPAGLIPN